MDAADFLLLFFCVFLQELLRFVRLRRRGIAAGEVIKFVLPAGHFNFFSTRSCAEPAELPIKFKFFQLVRGSSATWPATLVKPTITQ